MCNRPGVFQEYRNVEMCGIRTVNIRQEYCPLISAVAWFVVMLVRQNMPEARLWGNVKPVCAGECFCSRVE